MNTWVAQLKAHGTTTVEDARSDPQLIGAAGAVIGDDACAWAIEAAHDIIEAVKHDFMAEESIGVMTGHEGEAFEAGLLTTLVALRAGTPAPMVIRPRGAAENVRLAARQGVPVGTLLRTVWACHTRAQDALIRELETLTGAAEFSTTLLTLNAALYAYVDSYVKSLTAEYQDELVAWSGHIPAERLQTMRSLLAGEPSSPAAEQVLGLRLTDQHWIAIGWQPTDRRVPDRQAELSRFGVQVGRALGVASTLVLHHDGLADLWWTFTVAPSEERFRDVVLSVGLPAGAALAIGRPGGGVEGMRSSHASALQAAKVGRRAGGEGLWWYRDVRVMALLGADEPAARRFVLEELHGIDGTSAKTADLRDTLRCFLQAGQSRLLAARELNLAANTVAYRVARASELMGRPATERPLDTLLALQLAHHFPDYLKPDSLALDHPAA